LRRKNKGTEIFVNILNLEEENIMAKEIEFEFEKGGKFVAELFEKEAPKNCQTIWNALPIETEAIHAAYSGQSIWMVTRNYIKLEDVREENQKILGNLPGTVGIEVYPPETNLNRTELVIVYGPNYYPRTPFAGEKPLNRIGIIRNNLDELLEIGKNIREFGKQKVTIKKKV
jgi:hypothetical protein